MNIILRKSYDAESVIPPYRLTKFGAADFGAAVADGSTVKLLGVGSRAGQATVGGRIEVTRAGLEEVEYGGTVAAGDWLTSDSVGRAVTAAPAAGANAQVIGRAEVAGVAGDTGKVFISPCVIQG